MVTTSMTYNESVVTLILHATGGRWGIEERVFLRWNGTAHSIAQCGRPFGNRGSHAICCHTSFINPYATGDFIYLANTQNDAKKLKND